MCVLFSRREDVALKVPEVSIITDAPDSLRNYLFLIILQTDLGLKEIRRCLSCYSRAEDPQNWGENDFMKEEIRRLIQDCEWFYVYDVIEAIYQKLTKDKQETFSQEINRFFCKEGIGWKLQDGLIQYRGNEDGELILKSACQDLEQKGQETSTNELREAIKDFSRKPNPDLTGVIQHSNAALECLARKYADMPNKTLGKIITDKRDCFPQPIDEAIHKLWGYASNYGRHVQEGNPPSREEAELVLYLSASLCSYLSKKI